MLKNLTMWKLLLILLPSNIRSFIISIISYWSMLKANFSCVQFLLGICDKFFLQFEPFFLQILPVMFLRGEGWFVHIFSGNYAFFVVNFIKLIPQEFHILCETDHCRNYKWAKMGILWQNKKFVPANSSSEQQKCLTEPILKGEEFKL